MNFIEFSSPMRTDQDRNRNPMHQIPPDGGRLLRGIVAALIPLMFLAGCTDYDVPGSDRPWPKLNEFPAQPDLEAMEKRRRQLIGQYGDPAAALPQPGNLPARPPVGAVRAAVIQFDRGQAMVNRRSRNVLAQVAAYAQQGRATVWLFGYTSRDRVELASGKSARDSARALSGDRVRAVALALLDYGVPPERIELVARGRADPLFVETAPAGEAGNRRVEIYLQRQIHSPRASISGPR